MKKQFINVTFTALLLNACYVFAIEPVREGQEDSIMRAIFGEGRLWLLSDAGQLFSLAEQEQAPRDERVGEKIVDMCLSDGKPTVLLRADKDWSVQQHSNDAWVEKTRVSVKEDSMTMACNGRQIILLTKSYLVSVDGKSVVRTKLHGKLRFGVMTVLAQPDSLYLGYNAGEWGGGLQRVDSKTGYIDKIEKASGLFSRTISSDLDPVNGLSVVPWKRECVAAAIGMVHMDVSGRIVMICPNDITILYSKKFGPRYPNMDITEDVAYQTMAFFGLTATGDHLVAAGLDGLYSLKEKGKVEFETMPEFKTIGPFHVSFARPDLVLVLTTINQRLSLSGAVPMLVPR